MWFRRRRKHQASEQELNAYVDGQLAPDGRARLEEHLPSCAACREALAELRSLSSALRALPRESAPRSFALREADVEPAAVARPLGLLGRATPLLGGLTAAAVITFAVLVGVDVADQGFGGAAGGTADSLAVPVAVDGAADDPAAQRAMPEAAGDAADDEFLAGSSPAPTANAFALPLGQAQQASEERDPVTAPSVGATSGDNAEKAADIETNGSVGIGRPTPCAPSALCVNVQASDDLPQTSPNEPPSVSTVDEGAGYHDETSSKLSDQGVAGEFERRGDEDGGVAAPISGQPDGGGYTRIRSAETAMASLAIVGAASLALVWRRRRAEERR